MVVSVSALVFLRGHIELADEDWFSGEPVKCVQIKSCKRAIVPTRIQVARYRIHVRCARAGNLGIVKRLVAVAEDQGAAVIGANDLASEGVITFCHQTEKSAVGTDAIAARPQIKHTALLQFLKTLCAFGLEIVQEFRPVVMISLPEQLDESLPLAAGGCLLQRHLEQRRVPPAHFVVRVITKDSRIVTQRHNLVAGNLMHMRNDVRVPHIQPGHAGHGANVQNRCEGHLHRMALLQYFEIAPRTNGGEAPGLEALESRLGPSI